MTAFKTTDPDVVYAAIKRLALSEAASGSKRLSMRKILEIVRAQLRTNINNNLAPVLTRKLIADRPELAPLFETRQMGTRGKNVRENFEGPSIVLSLDAALREIAQLKSDRDFLLSLDAALREIAQLKSDRDFLLDLCNRTAKEAA